MTTLRTKLNKCKKDELNLNSNIVPSNLSKLLTCGKQLEIGAIVCGRNMKKTEKLVRDTKDRECHKVTKISIPHDFTKHVNGH